MARFLVAVAMVMSGFVCATSRALADEIPRRVVSVQWKGLVPMLGFSAKDFANHATEDKLMSGLPQTLVMRVYAYREDSQTPIAATARTCRVVYDLWQGGYRIEHESEWGHGTRVVTDLAGVYSVCLDADSLALGNRELYAAAKGKAIYFAFVVELNPMSQDTVQRIRRWIARPAGARMSGDAFFGSFVSIFVSRQMGSAERTMKFRSQPVLVPQ